MYSNFLDRRLPLRNPRSKTLVATNFVFLAGLRDEPQQQDRELAQLPVGWHRPDPDQGLSYRVPHLQHRLLADLPQLELSSDTISV